MKDAIAPFSPQFLDVLLGSPKNIVNLQSKGFLQVAVHGTNGAVTPVRENLDEITFGDFTLDPVPAFPERVLVRDVNRDGIEDFVFFFSISDLVENGAIDNSTQFVEMTLTFDVSEVTVELRNSPELDSRYQMVSGIAV